MGDSHGRAVGIARGRQLQCAQLVKGTSLMQHAALQGLHMHTRGQKAAVWIGGGQHHSHGHGQSIVHLYGRPHQQGVLCTPAANACSGHQHHSVDGSECFEGVNRM